MSRDHEQPNPIPENTDPYAPRQEVWGESRLMRPEEARVFLSRLAPVLDAAVIHHGETAGTAEEPDRANENQLYAGPPGTIEIEPGVYEGGHGIRFENDPKYEIKGYIFDWDDTISPTGQVWIDAHQEVLESYGIEQDAPTILGYFGNINFAETVGLEKFNRDGRQPTAQEIFDEVAALAKEKLRNVRIDPIWVATLRYLKANGAKISVVSSSPRDVLLDGVAANELTDVLDAVISADDVKRHKPYPDGLTKALEIMEVEPEHAIMVGDSANDVLAGKAAGTYTLKIWHPLHSEVQLEKLMATLRNATDSGDWESFTDFAKANNPTLTAHVAYAADLWQPATDEKGEPAIDNSGNVMTFAIPKGRTYDRLEPNFGPLVAMLTNQAVLQAAAKRERGIDPLAEANERYMEDQMRKLGEDLRRWRAEKNR